MESLRNATKNKNFVPVIIFVLMAMALLAVVVGQVGNQESTDIRSRASQSTFLTPGDDAFSLDKDLKLLEQDTTTKDEQELNSLSY